MNFIVGVDAEGMACVVGERGLGLTASRDFEFAKKQATREANAVARGLFAAGAESVVIWDNHGGSLNLDYHGIDERCQILCGKGDARRMSLVGEGYDGLVLLGYHAMEGTIDGILAHSFSSVTYQWMKVNGRQVGEIAIDSAIAGAEGVPTILIASDEAGCREAREFLPWVHTVATKRGLSRNMALSKSPATVERELEDASRLAALGLAGAADSADGAISNADSSGARRSRAARVAAPEPFLFDSPLTFELRYQRADAAEAKERSDPRFRRTDPWTVEATGASISAFF